MSQSAKNRERRDKWLHLKVSATERDQLKKLAAQQKSTVADLVRRSIDQRTSGVQPRQIRQSRKADPMLLAALGRIGSNINQIGRWVNTHKSGVDAVEVLAALSSIDRSIKELFPAKQPDENEETDDVGATI